MPNRGASLVANLPPSQNPKADPPPPQHSPIQAPPPPQEVHPLLEGDDPSIRFRIVVPGELRRALSVMTRGKPVVGTISNLAFSDMLLNWHHHVVKAGMGANALVGALDTKTLKFCEEHKIPALLLHSDLPTRDFRKSAKLFKEMGTLKTSLVTCILDAGWDLVMSDTDTAWLREPSTFFHSSAALGNADIMVTSDSISYSNDVASQLRDWTKPVGKDVQGWFRNATDRALQIFGNAYEHAFNTGVLFLRSTPATRRFAFAWHDVMRTKGAIRGMKNLWGDQHAFNELNRIRMFPIQVVEPDDGSPRSNRIFWTFNRTIKLAILPVGEFCNGHVFFVQQIPRAHSLRPYVVHNTFQFHYAPGKVARFRQGGLWSIDPPQYYTEGNFVSLEVTFPPWIVELPPGIGRHRVALEYAYECTRNALAIAYVLNRTLILPTVTCFCDRFWFLLTPPCHAPGTDVDPPFECPTDHFVDIGYWDAQARTLPYRVSTFLANPRTHPDIVGSRLLVRVVQRGEGDDSTAANAATLPKFGSDLDVQKALGSHTRVRVLHLVNPLLSFCGFERQDAAATFHRLTVNHFRLLWCCTGEANYPGKYYNISIPHVPNRKVEDCEATENMYFGRT